MVDAKWRPGERCYPTDDEKMKRMSPSGSRVWRNTRFDLRDILVPNINDDEILIKVELYGMGGSDTRLYETDEDGYVLFSGTENLVCILGYK